MQKFSAREYLKIDVASSFGLDKKTWKQRIAWFDDHQDRLEEMLPQAETPALYYAGVLAWRQVEKGEPTGFPISLDATASGLQILAVLTGDRSAAGICNVINSRKGDKREDAYTAVYESMLAVINETAKIDREQVKQAIMTSLYGSTAIPKKVFGESTLLTVFENTMGHLAPGAWELNQVFLDLWDDKALVNAWTMPDNFHVRVKVMAPIMEQVHFLNAPFDVPRRINTPVVGGRSLGANMIHSIDGMIVREMVRRCDHNPVTVINLLGLFADTDPEDRGTQIKTADDELVVTLWKHYQASGYLSARILEHLTRDNMGHVDGSVILELLDSLPAKPFQMIAVHDCFRCLPNYANDMRQQYNQQLFLIARSNLLGFLLSELLQRPITLGKLDTSLAANILDADYALS